MEQTNYVNYTQEIEKRDRRIRYLTIEVIRLGGGERCPRCNEWADIEQTEQDCWLCGGLGYYLPEMKEE